MNLYLITQDINNNYDTFDSAVVVAESKDAARLIHPSQYHKYAADDEARNSEWAMPDQVQAHLIGIATKGLEAGSVICASYNAG